MSQHCLADWEGALCIDRDGGWDWCPGIPKEDVKWYKGIDCIYLPSDKTINVCFTDSSKQTAIAPLVGENCAAKTLVVLSGKTLITLLTTHVAIFLVAKVYKFNTDKRMYYQPGPMKVLRIITHLIKYCKKRNGLRYC